MDSEKNLLEINTELPFPNINETQPIEENSSSDDENFDFEYILFICINCYFFNSFLIRSEENCLIKLSSFSLNELR